MTKIVKKTMVNLTFQILKETLLLQTHQLD